MNEFFNDLKADLLDRRMLPLLGVALVALVVAIGFVAIGGSSKSAPEPTAGVSSPSTPATSGISVIPATSGPGQAVAETTDGERTQRRGSARDPFTALPGTVAKTSSASTSTATSKGGASSTSGPGAKTETASKGSESKPSKSSTPPAPKPKMIFSVAFEFGKVPTGGGTPATELGSYPSVSKATPLPSAKERLIEFSGVSVTKTAVGARFTIDSELILKGAGTCVPSVTQCHALDLQEGKSEVFEAFSPSGALVAYELRLVAIATNSAKTASVHVGTPLPGPRSH